MAVQQFFFQKLWLAALGTVAGNILGNIQSTALGILAVMLVLSVYESFARGASLRDLVANLAKYAACAVVIQEWQPIFTEFSTGFSNIAMSLGAGDFVGTFQTMFNNQLQSVSIVGFTGIDWLALIDYIVLVLAMLIFYIVMILFEIFYTCWGLILFAMGPFLIALLPSQAAASWGKNYIGKTAEWAAWPILYALLERLTEALNLTTWSSLAATFPNPTAGNSLAGVVNEIQAAIISVVFVILMILIPFVAHFLIHGDFSGAIGAIKNVIMIKAAIMKELGMEAGKKASSKGAEKGAESNGGKSDKGSSNTTGADTNASKAPSATPSAASSTVPKPA
jgi:hypothetical protein